MRTAVILTAVIWHTVHSFTCTSSGLFANIDDTTCQSYIYCLKLPSGIYISHVYTCSTGQFYDPDLKKCNENYVCSSVTETTTEINTEITTEITTEIATEITTEITTETTTEITTEITAEINTEITTDITTGITTESSTTSSEVNSSCTAQGRFPNDEDGTCSSYYFCYYLTNGEYYRQNYSCPQGTRFDPTSQSCSTDYECGTITSSLDILTRSSSSSECTAQGRFPVETDVTCTSYYFCYYLNNGLYTRYNYTCPSNSRFDPSLQICSATYTCSTNDTTTTISSISDSTTATNTTSTCVSQGRFPVEDDVTCTSYYFCYYNTNGQYVKYNYSCPTGTTFDPTLQICSSTYTCGTTVSTESTSISSTTVSSASTTAVSECTQQGRFAFQDDATCRSYYFCYYLSDGSYQKYNYTCPSGFRFDPQAQACSTTYNCSTASTSRSLFSSSSLNSTTSNSFECIKQGRYPVQEDITCRSYYYCINLGNGTYVHEKYTCPSEARFDPFLQLCNQTFQCEASPTGETSNINSSPPTAKILEKGVIENGTFACVSAGKFPDVVCQNYYYCFSLSNGNFGQQLYSCAAGENFDPDLKECDQNYQCPIPPFECTTEGRFVAEEDPTCQTYHYCFSLPNQEFGHQVYSCASGQFDPEKQSCSLSYQCLRSTTTKLLTSSPFECSTTGKFSLIGDSTCQNYYYCFSLSNGQFGKHIYTCAADEKFDPELQKCSEDYQCVFQQAA